MSTEIGIWIGGFLTLAIMSFLYKDNPIYKAAEAIFIGVSAGYWAVYMYFNVVDPLLITNLMKGKVLYFVPLLLGLMMLARLLPSIGWISRWPMAFIIGITAGLNFTAFLASDVIGQIDGAIKSLNVWGDGTAMGFLLSSGFSNTIASIGVISTLVYFFFSKEHKGLFGKTASVGILFIMVAFGGSFGYTVMARISLLIGRMDFIFTTWLGLAG